ncbi:Serine/threonine-protein kinase 16 [Rhizophlyctis rosea]|uniref:non-specific serine/threonine protein kinase n=1 Tax=Rhizophlyctis rosea TaxID=64517 RepID=A0AAD5SGR6_9FUNG|nr:Serine/threonine-protein kinase 16 [Rhizophlyctis rosea]
MPQFQQLQEETLPQSGPSAMDFLTNFLAALWSSIAAMFAGFKPAPVVSVNNKKYTVTRQLGEGGFSFVYLVRAADNQHYALKRIRIQLPEQEERLKNEIAAHKAIKSPHVVQLVDAEIVRDRPNGAIKEGLLLLPFYGNGTVQDMIDTTPAGQFMPLKTILHLAVGVCKGLEAFHSHNPPLAFRDLKPANVLVDENDSSVLMDLGSVAPARVRIASRREAIALQDLCAETATAPFRAPELFDPPSDGTVDEKSDIWALGCTMYAMAFRNSPFDGSMTAAVGGKVTFPSGPNPYGEHFKALLQWIIVADPVGRPDVLAVRQRIEALLAGIDFEV